MSFLIFDRTIDDRLSALLARVMSVDDARTACLVTLSMPAGKTMEIDDRCRSEVRLDDRAVRYSVIMA
jgi:hypothetical protein